MSKKNTTKKSIKPAYTVDLSACSDSDDLKVSMIFAKADAGVPITSTELEYLITRVVKISLDIKYLAEKAFDCVEKFLGELEQECEKKPWYKRFWNWLTGRK